MRSSVSSCVSARLLVLTDALQGLRAVSSGWHREGEREGERRTRTRRRRRPSSPWLPLPSCGRGSGQLGPSARLPAGRLTHLIESLMAARASLAA